MESVFVAPPGWSWDIALYFFFGGLAGGALFLAGLLRLVGGPEDRPLARIGQYLAFPLINVCALLLIKDLGVPERFWHMVFQSERFPALMFKWWSPISFGTWIVTLFGVLALIAFVHALLEGGVLGDRRLRSERARSTRDRAYRLTSPLHDGTRWLGAAFLVLAALWGLVLAGYTGLILNSGNTPTWSRDPLIAPMFMASGVVTAAAAIFLIGHFTAAGTEWGRRRLLRTGFLALAFEAALLLIGVLLGIGHTSVYFLGWWGVFFWLVVLPVAFLAPLALLWSAEYRGRERIEGAVVIGAILMLAGGLLLRVLEVMGGQAYFTTYWHAIH